MRGVGRGIRRPQGGTPERSNQSCKRLRAVCYGVTCRGQPHWVNAAHGELVVARGVAAALARARGRAARMGLRALVTRARWFLHDFSCCRTLPNPSRTRRPPAVVLGALAPRSGVAFSPSLYGRSRIMLGVWAAAHSPYVRMVAMPRSLPPRILICVYLGVLQNLLVRF
jgi:hypothetical protein